MLSSSDELLLTNPCGAGFVNSRKLEFSRFRRILVFIGSVMIDAMAPEYFLKESRRIKCGQSDD